MQRSIALAVLLGTAATVSANQPAPLSRHQQLEQALLLARPDLDACERRAIDAGVFGEVTIRIDRRGELGVSGTRSFGPHASELAACVRDAMRDPWSRYFDDRDREAIIHVLRLGAPRALLPADALLPAWFRLVRDHDESARVDVARLLPPDYTLREDGCLYTETETLKAAELLWLPHVGSRVAPLWDELIGNELGLEVRVAAWVPSGAFVAQTDDGLCLVPFDSAQQDALRAQFDTVGTCWAGSFTDVLLAPHVEFPADRTYRSVAVNNGRTCAVATDGSVDCCGRAEWPLPPAPRRVASIALGRGFACGLDRRNHAVCWGNIGPAPAGTFDKLSAWEDHVCGLETSGEVACWGTIWWAPAGRFVDVSAGGPCAVRENGKVECWTREPTYKLEGSFVRVFSSWTHGCGVRTDKTIGCWDASDGLVDTPMPFRFIDVVTGDALHVCGRREDGTLSCWGTHPWSAVDVVRSSPSTRFKSLDASYDQLCGVRVDGHIECFGDPWPGSFATDTSWRLPALLVNTTDAPPFDGRVLDEFGRPISGAEVVVCADPADGGYTSACTLASYRGRTSANSLTNLITASDAEMTPYAIVRTDIDGRWKMPSGWKAPAETEVHVVVTAPGRELVERTVGPRELLGPRGMVRTIVAGSVITLRPASNADLELQCPDGACTETVYVEGREGTHIERLAPGTHTLSVRTESLHGRVVIDVGYESRPQRIRVTMTPNGQEPVLSRATPPRGGCSSTRGTDAALALILLSILGLRPRRPTTAARRGPLCFERR